MNAAGERDNWQGCERQLQAHYGIENVVHVAEIFHVRVNGNEQSGDDGDSPGEENAPPADPLKIEKAFHRELTGVSAGHRRRLSGSENPDRPYEHCHSTELATEVNSTFVQIGFERIAIVLKKNNNFLYLYKYINVII